MISIVDCLKEMAPFAGLTDKELATLQEKTIFRSFPKKTVICREGETGNYICFVNSGRVKLSKGSGEGREKTLHILKEGQYFGETLLFEGGEYNFTAETVEDAALAMVSRQAFEDFLMNNPDVTLKILKELSFKLRSAQRQIKNLSLKDAHSRMAIRLFKLAREYGEQSEAGTRINISLSHQELADFISASRETATRILNEFERQKIISVDRQFITIINDKKLREWM